MLIPDMPDQGTLAPVAWGSAFTPLLLEIEPGHWVDLAKVIEWDDHADTSELLAVLPAGAFDGNGPHALVLTGDARVQALAFVRWRSSQTQQMFAQILK